MGPASRSAPASPGTGMYGMEGRAPESSLEMGPAPRSRTVC